MFYYNEVFLFDFLNSFGSFLLFQEAVLNETLMIIPDCQKRLNNAYNELKTLLMVRLTDSFISFFIYWPNTSIFAFSNRNQTTWMRQNNIQPHKHCLTASTLLKCQLNCFLSIFKKTEKKFRKKRINACSSFLTHLVLITSKRKSLLIS